VSPSEDERTAEAFLRDHAPPRRDPRVVALHQAEDDPREIDDGEDQDQAQVAPPPVIVDSVRNFVHNTIQLTSGI
jgi:hypothetical protein